MHNIQYVRALAKALDFESDAEFIVTAFGPKGLVPEPDRTDREEHPLTGTELAMIALIHDWPEREKQRAVRVVAALSDPS